LARDSEDPDKDLRKAMTNITRKKVSFGKPSLYTLAAIIIKFKNTKNDIPNSIR